MDVILKDLLLLQAKRKYTGDNTIWNIAIMNVLDFLLMTGFHKLKQKNYQTSGLGWRTGLAARNRLVTSWKRAKRI